MAAYDSGRTLARYRLSAAVSAPAEGGVVALRVSDGLTGAVQLVEMRCSCLQAIWCCHAGRWTLMPSAATWAGEGGDVGSLLGGGDPGEELPEQQPVVGLQAEQAEQGSGRVLLAIWQSLLAAQQVAAQHKPHLLHPPSAPSPPREAGSETRACTTFSAAAPCHRSQTEHLQAEGPITAGLSWSCFEGHVLG